MGELLFNAVSASRKMAILGCGYVGTALALQAMARGYQVVAFVRSSESAQRLQALGITTQAFDLITGDFGTLPKDFTVVVYAASSGGGGVAAYQAIYDQGVKRAVAWAQNSGVAKFIFTSSTSVYRQDDGAEVDETFATGGTENAEMLLQGERAVLTATIPARWVLRFGGLYGPGRHYLLDQLKRGEKLIGGRVDHFINYLHREDAAQALLLAAESSRTGNFCYNITDGHPVTKAELAQWIATQLGMGILQFNQEAPAGPRMQREGRSAVNRRILSSRFRSELGWNPQFSTVFEGLTPFLGL